MEAGDANNITTTVESGGTWRDTVERPPKRQIDLSPRKAIKRKKKEKSGKMASFVFFDVETTGLFRDNGMSMTTGPMDTPEKIARQLHKYTVETPRSARPHMTEISFVCVSRKAFEAAAEKMKRRAQENSGDKELDIRCEVVFNVHTRQVNPSLTEDEWKQYEGTRRPETNRLTREVLAEKSTFAQEWEGLKHLLATAPKPTCIVAHNGLSFDFRVLHGELEKAGLLTDGWLPEDVFFVDSLLATREIDSIDNTQISVVVENVDWNAVGNARALAVAQSNKTEEEDVVAETPEELQPGAFPPSILRTNHTPTRPPPTVSSKSAPTKLYRNPFSLLPYRTLFGQTRRSLFPEVSFEPMHPLNFIRTDEWTVAKQRRVQSSLFKKSNGKWSYDPSMVAEISRKRGLFRQETLFDTIFKKPYTAHQAQADSEALLQICLAYGTSFLEYADTMAADIIY